MNATYRLIDAIQLPRLSNMAETEKKEVLSRIDCGLAALQDARNPISRAISAGNLAGDDATPLLNEIKNLTDRLLKERSRICLNGVTS